MRIWKPFAALGGLLVLAVGVGVILLSTQDVSKYRDVIAQQISEATGREFTIAGDFDLRISLSPAIVAEQVTFQNAPWGSRPEMLTLRRLEAEVALLPMLSGTIQIKRLILEDADILLETDQSGRGNWQFEEEAAAVETAGEESSSETEAPEEVAERGLPIIEDIQIRRAVLSYRDGRSGDTRTIHIERAEGSSTGPDGPFNLTLQGLLDDMLIEAEASIGTGQSNIPISAHAEFASAEVTIDGTIADPGAAKGLDLSVAMAGESLATLSDLSGVAMPAVGPFRLSGQLRDDGKGYILENLMATFGDSDLAGTLRFEEGGERPKIEATLTSRHLNLDSLLASAETDFDASDEPPAVDDAPAQPGATAPPERIFSDDPLPLDALGAVDAQIALEARVVRYAGITLEDLHIKLVLDDGAMTLRPLTARVAGGELRATASLDSGLKVPALNATLALHQANLEGLLAALEIDHVASGPVNVEAALKGRGASMHAIAAGLDGHVGLTMSKSRIDSAYVDLLAADLVQTLIPGGPSADDTNVNCLVARFAVVDGVAHSRALLFDTARMTIGGEGQIDLGAERVNMKLVPRPKDPALLSLAVPVNVTGPLSDPNAAPDAESVALGLAGAVLGSAINPLGILLPLVSPGSSDENPCLEALARPVRQQEVSVKAPAAAPSPPAEELGGPAEEPRGPKAVIEGIFETIGGLFD